MAKQLKANQPTHEEIATRARCIYEMEGCPEGRAVEHWLMAEAQLIDERKAQQPEAPGKAPRATSTVKQAKPRKTTLRV